MNTPPDIGLNNLLELDGEIFNMTGGYWTKIEARQVNVSAEIPHGIKYSLTLHDKTKARILGYDNAHAVKSKRKGFHGRIVQWDHKHEREMVTNYHFRSAGQLLEDFWNDVNRIIDND